MRKIDAPAPGFRGWSDIQDARPPEHDWQIDVAGATIVSTEGMPKPLYVLLEPGDTQIHLGRSIPDLPVVMQERLAVLMLTDAGAGGTRLINIYLPGVGFRRGKNWVVLHGADLPPADRITSETNVSECSDKEKSE